MICPKCSCPCDDELRFCDHCGTDLLPAAEEIPVIVVVEKSPPAPVTPVSEPSVPVTPAPKKGRLWPPLVILAVMICVGTLVFFLLPGQPLDNAPPAGETPWFSIDKGVLFFHPEYYQGSAELTIPETVNGQKVTAIADYAFSGQNTLTTVILPDTVKHIGDYAFSSCTDLRGIYIPSSVSSIGVYAFADCDSLEAIYLPGSLEELGHDSLSSCDSLHYILFDGTYSQWTALYDGYFVSTVELHATDGVYYSHP